MVLRARVERRLGDIPIAMSPGGDGTAASSALGLQVAGIADSIVMA